MAEGGLRKPPELSFEGNVAHNWKVFKEEFEIYSNAALHDKTDKVKAYTLLNLAGAEAIKRSKTFEYLPAVHNEDNEIVQQAENKEDVEVLIKKFDELCNPQSNVSMERHLFFTRDQRQGETVDSYITDLKHKAKTCEFGDIKDGLIRDRFISGVTSEQLRRVLLKEKSLTLQRTIEIAQLDEITQARLKQFKSDKEIHSFSKASTQQYQKGKPGRPRCGNCVEPHHKSERCKAKGKQCGKCGKYNHFAHVCKSQSVAQHNKKPWQHKTSQKRGSKYKKVHEFDAHTDESEEEFFVIEDIDINHVSKKDEVHVKLKLNKEPVTIKVDTGAKCNVMSRELASKISKAQKMPIKVDRTKRVKLIAYGGTSFYTMGTAQLDCDHAGQTSVVTFHIVDKPVKALLGLQDSVKLNLLTLSPEVFELNQDKSIPEFHEYADLFADTLGKLPMEYNMTVDPTVSPVIRSARQIPIAMRDRVKQELDSMESQGVISKITDPTDWCSNMVCAKKKDKDQICLCIDPKDLNKALKRPHHPLKTVDSILSRIPDAKVFSVLDAKSSFWQIPLEKESRKLTCFATPFGRYVFNVLPYGVTVGSEVYQRTIKHLFMNAPCGAVIDDILVWGKHLHDHDKKLKQVLNRCRKINIRLNPKKCRFRVNSVHYVGHVLSDTGVQPDPDKIQAINGMPEPQDIKSLQRFLGMVNYLSRFIQNQSELTAPLRQLLHKDIDFKWEPSHATSFKKLKQAIANIATLQYFNVRKSVKITCDSPQSGIGAALLQDDKPIHFASRALSPTEIRYAQIQKELLAVVFAVTKFRQYIFGKSVTVETDHAPLVTIMKKSISEAPASLQKLLLKIQSYDINVIHKPGREMYIADTLSRAYPPTQQEQRKLKSMR